MKDWESKAAQREAEQAARIKAAGWAGTRLGYRQQVHLVLNDKRVLLREAPNHVPVLAQDLEYMLDEINQLEAARVAIAAMQRELEELRGRGMPP